METPIAITQWTQVITKAVDTVGERELYSIISRISDEGITEKVVSLVFEHKGIVGWLLNRYDSSLKQDVRMLIIYFLKNHLKYKRAEISKILNISDSCYTNYNRTICRLSDKIKSERDLMKDIEILTPRITELIDKHRVENKDIKEVNN